MFNPKTSQREQELETLLMQRDSELNDYRNRLAEASRAIADYQNRESSIIGALTEAHASSQRMLDEAAVNRDQMLLEAQQKKEAAEAEGRAALESAQQQANEILSNAQVQANEIIAEANAQANALVQQAQGEYDNCKKVIDRMNERLTATAEDATRKIEEFKAVFTYDVIEPEEVNFSTYAAAPLYTAPAYEAPAYEAPVYDIPQQPVFEEPAAQYVPQTAETVILPAENFFEDNKTAQAVPDFFSQEPVSNETQVLFTPVQSPFDAPMPEPMPILKSEEEAAYQAPQTVPSWSFEQPAVPVWNEQNTTENNSNAGAFDAELDALINDVLNN